MSGLTVAVAEEPPGERRVALVPESVRRLTGSGLQVIVPPGAGAGAWISDAAFSEAGARILAAPEAYAAADVVLAVAPPAPSLVAALRAGQALVGMLQPLTSPDLVRQLAQRGITAVSLDGLPRTLSRAQAMDALTSQASVAGYRAVIEAAHAYGRYFPLLITAAGTAKPAETLVLGAGVAGLQAMATARRLGAVVRGYDIRPETRQEVASLGAEFLELQSVRSGSGEGGYARMLDESELAAQQAELDGHIARHDVVITTAQVPGRRPPLLVRRTAVERMRAGSVIVDMAASAHGGNVEGSVAGQTVVTGNGVTVIGADDLASRTAGSASAAYSRNVTALLLHLLRDGALAVDLTDEVQAGVVVTHGGEVVHPAAAARLAGQSTEGAAR
ncbi:NAD(P) transhydrogenase subunit alpha [Motilibacter deserti]|uniref:proton-translocating NAD(P)(+) transhydrogenase n=1 Tax=Motilibacter deserti TaxID=2714956 RepID=A0ABX0GQ51_9ACTN|nr:NAD(P) transhydrogenase subunit alpha [Motilibacter deserti]NHC12958.1 NAD(P) transhydrogenase subunit alpha [Motilibacter deserti]